jgi:lipid A ethanolaminephosphotransferase
MRPPSAVGSNWIPLKKFFSPHIGAHQLTFAVAVFLAGCCNLPFWKAFATAAGGASLVNLPLLAATFALIVLVFHACLTMASFRFAIKPVLILMLVATSAASYFMGHYGVVIDKSMVQNVVETDTREASELVSWGLFWTVALLGVLPSLLIARVRVRFSHGVHGMALTAGTASTSLAVAVVIMLLCFKSLAPVLREHRELRFLLTPTNVVQAIHGYVGARWSAPVVVAPLGKDAVKGLSWTGQARRTVTVIVVGETARAQNFALNGYLRATNPLLSQQEGLINFPSVESCGTATAVSVPCVFSDLGREHYSDRAARRREGLLDVLAHAGFTVLWRDNNSGCKGVCDRVAFQDLSRPQPGDPLCAAGECYDERLLEGLPELIRTTNNDMVIVLHQKGSHGPAYAQRYPRRFERFTPVCGTVEFEGCSRDSILAAYDNSILYTDYVLSKAIDMLRGLAQQEQFDTALLYFSDHGESLGERGLYLHGAPYMIAPPEQTHVPLMLWMSDSFSQRFRIDRTCLKARRHQAFSHDNVFHSVLGMLDVNTAVFNPRLNLFNACSYASL